MKRFYATDIYLHDYGQFNYYREDDMPSSMKINNEFLKNSTDTSIICKSDFKQFKTPLTREMLDAKYRFLFKWNGPQLCLWINQTILALLTQTTTSTNVWSLNFLDVEDANHHGMYSILQAFPFAMTSLSYTKRLDKSKTGVVPFGQRKKERKSPAVLCRVISALMNSSTHIPATHHLDVSSH